MKFRCGKTVTGLILGGLFVVFPAFATSYSYDLDVQFNFNSKLGVTITDADIKILDLAPGTSADSNVVGITISTNNVAGYTAEATVGDAQNATTNMTHTNGTNTFTSIATDASQASLSTDNTWGYAISTDNGTSWSNFSGLPIYTEDGKELASTDSPAQDAIQFKINAKASTSQPAGDYTNVINFKVVANTPPRDWEDVKPNCTTNPTKCDDVTHLPKIQAINEDICEAMETYDTQLQVTDSRDHKNYWISKLRDSHCWMTQNLDFDIDSTKTYTNADTDLGWNGTGYSTASWTPDRSTIPVTDISSSGTYTGWGNSSTVSYSVDTGDWYWTDTWYPSTTNNYLNSGAGNKFSQTPYTGNGTHGHVGNYYNWTAAIASNDSSSYNTSTYSDISRNPQNSVCPAGWRLPTVSSISNTDEFTRINTLYGNTLGDDRVLTADPVWFVRGGYAGYSSGIGNLNSSGYGGYYWSSTVGGNNSAHDLYFSSSNVAPAGHDNQRNGGWSVRCVARTKTPYTITFNANSGTGTMTSQQIKRGSSAKLSANTFTKEGYYFNGWNTKADGKGEGYGDKQLYEVAKSNEQNGITLYAQWTTTRVCTENCESGSAKYESGITIQRAYELVYTEHHLGMYEETAKGNGIYERVNSWPPDNEPYKGYDVRFAMQDIDLTYNGVKVCDLVTVIGDQYQALDVRDNKLYYISKLADGRCWMTQNLDFNIVAGRTYTSNETDLVNYGDNSYTSDKGYELDNGVIKWTPNAGTVVTNVSTFEFPARAYYIPASVDVGDWYYNGTFGDYSGVDFLSASNDKTIISDIPFAKNDKHGHLGNYYDWTAAVASNNSEGVSGVQQNSVCPKGWRMLENGEFGDLITTYGVATNVDRFILEAPFYFARAGAASNSDWRWDIGSVGAGRNGSIYFSNEYNSSGAMFASWHFGNVSTSFSYNGRYDAYSIRCVARGSNE